MECFKDDFDLSHKTKKTFRIIIVGAGIAGLAASIGLKRAGHDIVLLEQASQINEIGAGIQVAPNAARVLGRFGVLEKAMERANILKNNSLRRWQDNQEIGKAPLMPQVGERYNAPLSVIYRGDLQHILLESVYAEKVDIRLNHKVVEADQAFEARVRVTSGDWIEGDVVIVADGIKSEIRAQMAKKFGVKDRSTPTGDAAYRVLIPREKIKKDGRALELLDTDAATRWMGPGGHVMAYPIKNNSVYNMVLIHPQKPNAEQTESWIGKGNKTEMMDVYRDWDELIRLLLSYVPDGEVNEWTLNSHRRLPHWYQNKCVLIGDSCHPMLPYVAQGAAQALEDAGVLTVALSLSDDVSTALGVYEAVRKSRGESIQDSAATTRTALHLADGPEQEKRDEAICNPGPNPDLWADRAWQDFMWGVDVMKETKDNWDKWVDQVNGHDFGDVQAVS